jgi:hypothetical protein
MSGDEPKQADLVLGLMAQDQFTFDQDGNLYVICKDLAGNRIIITPYSEKYKGIISQRFFSLFDTVPDSKHHRSAVSVMHGSTTKTTELYIRIAGENIGTLDAEVVYNLCNNRDAVQITPDPNGLGVAIIDVPMKFKDTGFCGTQVKPNMAARIEDIKKFYKHIKIKPPIIEDCEQQDLDALSISEIVEHRKLVLLAWVIYNLLPDTKDYKLVRPGVKITGPPGSAKTFNAIKILSIPDPIVEEIYRKPDDMESLGLSLYNRWIPAYDNIKELSDAESDMFCQTATGIDVRRRKRYTDNDTVGTHFRRACIITGISDVLTRADAAERFIPIELQKLDPKDYVLPDQVMKSFMVDLPDILGAAFKILSILLYRLTGDLPQPKTGHRMIQFLTIGRMIAEIITPGPGITLLPEYATVSDEGMIRKTSSNSADVFEAEFLTMMDTQEAGMADINVVASQVITYIMNGPPGTNWSRQITFKEFRDDILRDMASRDMTKDQEYKAIQAMSTKDFKRELMTFLKGINSAGIEIKIIEPTPGVKTGKNARARLKYRRIA